MSSVDAPLEALVRAAMLRHGPRARRRQLSWLRDLAAQNGERRAAEAERKADGALLGLCAPVLGAPAVDHMAIPTDGAPAKHAGFTAALGPTDAR